MAENKRKILLHLFEGGAAGAAAGTGDGGGEAAAAVQPGVLQDGTKVDTRLAARMEEQARRRKARGEAPVTAAPAAAQEPDAQKAPEEPKAPSLDEEWAEAKKGKFRDLFSRDVQGIIQDRFKNQKDANDQLSKLQPALKALARQRGIDENDTEGLINDILSDDSVFEKEAEERGMTVEAYRTVQELEAENARYKEQEQQAQERIFFQQHLQKLAVQAEELKKTYPKFDLMEELKNPNFRRMTGPNVGVSVADAFYAIHHGEIESGVLQYGIQKAQKQIAQTLAANAGRPTEGAMNRSQIGEIAVDPRSMTREQRQQMIERARRGEKIVF